MNKRIILLHSHIFKNAGTTIDAILKVNFQNSASFIESPDGQFISNEKIIATCLANQNISSLSSHKIRVSPPHHPDLHFIPLVMLRNPLDRLGSMYNYYRNQESSSRQLECKLAQRLAFKDFVQILIESGNDSSFANLQTQFFLRQSVGLTEETWPIAVTNFQEAVCVGTVEKFDESIALWTRYLVEYFPGIDCSYKKMNVSVNRATSMLARLSVLEKALGEELLDIFYKRNRYDYQLHDLAMERVRREVHVLAESTGITHLGCSEGASPVEGEARIAPYQVEADKVATTDKNSTADQTLCMVNDGIQLKIPRISRDSAVMQQEAVVIGCGLFDADNQPIHIVRQGQTVMVLLAVTVSHNITKPVLGITVKDHLGTIIFAMNTNYSSNKADATHRGFTNFYSFNFIMPPLNQGSYSITPAVAIGSQEHHTVLDVADDAALFFIPAMINPRLPGILYLQDFNFSNFGSSS